MSLLNARLLRVAMRSPGGHVTISPGRFFAQFRHYTHALSFKKKSTPTEHHPQKGVTPIAEDVKEADDVLTAETTSLSGENSVTPVMKHKSLPTLEIESPIRQVSTSTATTCTVDEFNDVLRQNTKLKKDVEFQLGRNKLKMIHINHLRYGMNQELKDILYRFHSTHKNSLRKYESWKEGLDAVFRLNRAVIIKTRRGDEVLITGAQGFGGYGRVAKGYHMSFNWAKVVVKEFLGFDEQKNRLQYNGEVQTLKELCRNDKNDAIPHEFIPHYIDRKEERGSYFLMSAWAGNDISKMDTYQKSHLLGHIGSSLVYILRAIHKKGFLHRDIKQQNICIDETDTVRLIDVGSMLHVNETGRVVTNQPYNDYEHCSLNMHKAYGKHTRCELSLFDDLWMVIFTLLGILNLVPGYWKEQRQRVNIIADKRRIVSNDCTFFKGSSSALTTMKKAISYLRDSNADNFDYDYLAKILSQL